MVRSLLRRLLDRVDRWVERHEQYRPVGEGGYILRIRVARHRRDRVVLADGTVVNRGDPVGELHLNNTYAAALHGEGYAGLRFRREMTRALAALARDLNERPEYRKIQACCGATLFWRDHGLGARLGFERRPPDPWTRWWLGTWERILLAAYHPGGAGRLGGGRVERLDLVWITRKSLARFDRAARRPHARRAAAAPADSPSAVQ
jgi:hypothetical protein